MPLSLTVLGSNAAMPGHGRFTSCQVLKSKEKLYMIDCGEGAQIRLSQYKIKRNKIELILISHLHGDHIFGLPGVISSFFHFNRRDKLTIIGPVGLKAFIDAFMATTQASLDYELEIIENSVSDIQKVYENDDIEIYAFPLKHRVPTNGYRFNQKSSPRNISKDQIAKFHLNVDEIKQLKRNENVQRANGQMIYAEDVLIQKDDASSFAYCSDTVFDPELVKFIKAVDLLYHETTYLHELAEKARERMHSTSIEAAQIAKLAEVKQLMIGHYSGKYRKPDELVKEARSLFENSIAAYDGLMIQF